MSKTTGKENLKPARTKAEARERGRNGGLRSGAARREKKLVRQALEKSMGMSLDEAAKNLWEISKNKKNPIAAIRAIEVIRDTMGEKPTDKVEMLDKISAAEADELENEIAAVAISKTKKRA